MTLPIPAAALDDRLAFIGNAGSGKTYAAGVAVEQAMARGHRAVIVDPLGVWWGLRLGEDGRAPGFPVVIFGGAYGDLPLTEGAAALIGETAAAMAESAIVDLSALGTKAAERRFMLAFLTALYRKAGGAPLLLVIDEADMFAPQVLSDRDGDAARCLGMMETVVRRGRVKGFIPWLITQRPAVLNKNVLSQADGLVALKLTAAQDRTALKAWVEGMADAAQLKALTAELPSLQRGQARLWIPSRGIYERVAFPKKTTFDSSAAPKRGEKKRAADLAPLDIAALKSAMATVEAETKANDPAALKAEIARLKKVAAGPSLGDVARIEAAAEQRGFERGLIDRAQSVAILLGSLADAQRERAEAAALLNFAAVQDLRKELLTSKTLDRQFCVPPATAGEGRAENGGGRAEQPPPPRERGTPLTADGGPPPIKPQGHARDGALYLTQANAGAGGKALGAERRPLQILVDRAPTAFTEAQWATLAGMKRTGGTWAAYKSRLKTAGMIEQEGGLWRATSAALQTLDRRAADGSALDQWRAALGGGPAKLIDILEAAPAPMSREALAAAAGLEPSGGTFAAYLSRLKSNGVVEKSGRGFALAEVLR